MHKRKHSTGRAAVTLGMFGAAAGCMAMPDRPQVDAAGVDWSLATTHFENGEAAKPMVYDRKDASRCVGRWRLHADALDDGAFSPEQQTAMTKLLNLERAIGLAEFFTIDTMAPALVREASDEAETQLRRAFAGDGEAFRQYFEALGRCSSRAESVRDEGVGAMDAPAEG